MTRSGFAAMIVGSGLALAQLAVLPTIIAAKPDLVMLRSLTDIFVRRPPSPFVPIRRE